MDVTTLIGILIGILLIINGIGRAEMGNFVDIPSIMIVLGGVLSAIFASYPLYIILDIPKHIKVLMRGNRYSIPSLVAQFVELAEVPRRDGFLALEDYLDDIKNPFLKKGILMILDTNDSDKVRYMLEREIYNMEIRHNRVADLYETASLYAPAFGMIGTLIGLIDMLKQLDETPVMGAGTMGSAMSIALITTFYGCILSNLIFHPIAKKLRIRQDEEEMYCGTVIEGIVAIHTGKGPQEVKNELWAYIKHSQQKKYNKEQHGEKSWNHDRF